jgi:hypothetical protein
LIRSAGGHDATRATTSLISYFVATRTEHKLEYCDPQEKMNHR